jgi:hypothetical protein
MSLEKILIVGVLGLGACDAGSLDPEATPVAPPMSPVDEYAEMTSSMVEAPVGHAEEDPALALVCSANMDTCGGSTCLDLNLDANNCGACGNVCASGVCYAGECIAPMAGSAVVIGHSFKSRSVPLELALGNAVFGRVKQKVNVLVYAGSASADAIAGTNAAIAAYAKATRRSWGKAVTTAVQLHQKLQTADVLLIYAQAGATDASLTSLGTQWRIRLDDFLRRGGTIIVLEGGEAQGAAGQAYTSMILEAAQLVTLGRPSDVSGDVGGLTARDALGAGVPLGFDLPTGAQAHAALAADTVVTASNGRAVVARHVFE